MFAIIITLAFAAVAAAESFDVVSVKPHPPGEPCGESRLLPGGQFIAQCWTLHEIVREALDVVPDDVSGGDKWVKTELWDIHAKAEGIDGELSTAALRIRLLALAKEEFGVKLRTESKRVPGFKLVVAKKGRLGPDLHRNSGAARNFTVKPGATLTAQKISMKELADWLKWPAGASRKVVDKTGLDGEYDFVLSWVPLNGDGSANGPTIFTALQEQLGLKVETDKVLTDSYEIVVATLPRE